MRTRYTESICAALLCFALLAGIAASAGAATTRVRLTLGASGAEPNAGGRAQLTVRSRSTGISGKLNVKATRLAPNSAYDVTIDGVRIGGFTTRPSGTGRARFRTTPSERDQLLGVDPRGRSLAVVGGEGAVVLLVGFPLGGVGGTDPNKVRCCLPDDSGPECEDRTAAECAAQGGTDLGPGSCLPNPCQDGTPAPGSEGRCCLPDDSGPECEDRTAAECAAQAGINLGAGACVPNPCSPAQPGPDDDIRCCLPDDSGPECEDRTAAECAAQGGLNIGPGTCLPNPCLSGATTTTVAGNTTTTTTLPGAGSPALDVICERRANRSRISVNGSNLAPGSYGARVTSEANTATAAPIPTVGDEVELDFDSDPADIAAGATAIAASFIQGTPPQVTGQLLDDVGTVVAETIATCDDR
jgi:hypothetical protein